MADQLNAVITGRVTEDSAGARSVSALMVLPSEPEHRRALHFEASLHPSLGHVSWVGQLRMGPHENLLVGGPSQYAFVAEVDLLERPFRPTISVKPWPHTLPAYMMVVSCSLENGPGGFLTNTIVAVGAADYESNWVESDGPFPGQPHVFSVNMTAPGSEPLSPVGPGDVELLTGLYEFGRTFPRTIALVPFLLPSASA